MTTHTKNQLTQAMCAAMLLALSACTSPQKAPATADVAVSKNAVENAVSAGAADLAPAEINTAREKMMRANAALAAKDYTLARDLATQAQAAAAALDADVRTLRNEVERANTR